jgi:ubiquinone/menaquinone biosynthesis C-methylase UbiE
VGCGIGTQAVYLAEQGWQVTGAYAVERTLAQVQQRAETAGMEVRWVAGDVARLGALSWSAGLTSCTTVAVSLTSPPPPAKDTCGA